MSLGLVANIAIGIAFVSVICLLCARYLEHRGKEQQFCADCLSYGITDAINPSS